jgi:hypothetical protein
VIIKWLRLTFKAKSEKYEEEIRQLKKENAKLMGDPIDSQNKNDDFNSDNDDADDDDNTPTNRLFDTQPHHHHHQQQHQLDSLEPIRPFNGSLTQTQD